MTVVYSVLSTCIFIQPIAEIFQYRLEGLIHFHVVNNSMLNMVILVKPITFREVKGHLVKHVYSCVLYDLSMTSMYGCNAKNSLCLRKGHLPLPNFITMLHRERLCKNEAWYTNFWRSVQNIVEKDVVRTDRGHTYYKGEGNSNVEVLKEILLNYAVAHPHLGYTQVTIDTLLHL